MESFQKSLYLFLPFFFALLSFSHAYTFKVGGKDGWTLHPSENYSQWSSRMRFLTNDTLHFKYNVTLDSVLEVSKGDYDNCNTNNPLTTLAGGDSSFKLIRPGPFYFISGNKSNCDQGQKLTVVVLSPKTKPPPPAAASPPTAASPPSFSPVPPVSPVSPSPQSGTPTSTSPALSPGGGASTSPVGSSSPGGGASSSPDGSPASSPGGGASSSPDGSPASSPGGGASSSPYGSPASSPGGGASSSPYGTPASSPGGGAPSSPTGNPADVNAPAPTGSSSALSATLTVSLVMIIFELGWLY